MPAGRKEQMAGRSKGSQGLEEWPVVPQEKKRTRKKDKKKKKDE
jgi:hypothetical protein